MSDFVIENGVLMKYTGPGGDVVIPSKAKSIGYGAFRNCTSLTGITFPASIKSMDDHAFTGCIGLESLTLPKNMKDIGGIGVFSGCTGLKEVTLPEGATGITVWAFSGCTGLTHLRIPESMEYINDWAFTDCVNLKSLAIPGTMSPASYKAFDYPSIERLYLVGTSMEKLPSAAKVILAATYLAEPEAFTPEQTEGIEAYIQKGASYVAAHLIEKQKAAELAKFLQLTQPKPAAIKKYLEKAEGEMKALLLDWQNGHVDVDKEQKKEERKMERELLRTEPSAAELKKLWSTKKQADGSVHISSYKGLGTEVVIPPVLGKAPVTGIGEKAFSPLANACPNKSTRLTDILAVTVPEGVTVISANAFDWCRALEKITLPASVKKIGPRAFSNCDKLTICAPAKSFAEKYAKRNNIPFEAV